MSRSVAQLWERARRYMDAGQAAPARASLESILLRDPADAAAHMVLGALYATDDQQRAVTRHMLAAAANPPADVNRLGDLIAALIKVGEVLDARNLLGRPMIAESNSPQVLMRAASQRQLIGEHAAALALIERARKLGASGRDFHFYRAVLLAFNGNLEEAETELGHCIALNPPLGRAYVQLARMRKQTPQFNHLRVIDAALQSVEPDSEDHAALGFARYKELEDLGRHDEAWQALAQGSALMHARLSYSPVREAALFNQLMGICTPEFVQTDRAVPNVGPQPIFVIGMPRSGTTVLERVLGNHSQVTSAGELGDFSHALAWASDHLAPVMLDETTLERLATVDWAEVAHRYLRQTQWRARGKTFYVDKLPRNWMVAGLIHKALPQAKILHLVREPMDTCFSNYRAYFGPGPEYAWAYDLDSLASHYRQYRRVMTHWHAAMPNAILDVEYSRLVNAPTETAREVLAFCGVDFEPGCANLMRNTSPSATLSMAQVRQPIHARSFGEWRPYEQHLSELLRAL